MGQCFVCAANKATAKTKQQPASRQASRPTTTLNMPSKCATCWKTYGAPSCHQRDVHCNISETRVGDTAPAHGKQQEAASKASGFMLCGAGWSRRIHAVLHGLLDLELVTQVSIDGCHSTDGIRPRFSPRLSIQPSSSPRLSIQRLR